MSIQRAECRNGRIVLLASFLVLMTLGSVHAGWAFLPSQYLTMRVAIDGVLPAVGEVIDCNENGIDDAQDIVDLTSPDCNQNGIPDECEINENSTAPGGPFFCTDQCDADCNQSGVPDECELAGNDGDGDGIPDECDICNNNLPETCTFSSPIIAPPPHDILKNRYISIDPRGEAGINAGLTFAIRVDLESSLVNGVTGTGPWFAGLPDAECFSLVTAIKPPPLIWDDCPILHLTGCPIIPTSTYEISVVIGGLLSGPPLVAATQAKPGLDWHGDCVGHFNGSEWTAPNGVVSIDDAVAALKTFQTPTALPGCGTPPCNATHLSVTDMSPNLTPGAQINKVVGIGDVFSIILGFQGSEYPGSDLTLCP